MTTEVGQISGMLSDVEQEKTPLTRQLDQLTVAITIMAGISLVDRVVLGLLRGDSFDELFLIGISVAIAAIPTELPAVVTAMLSLGTARLRRRARSSSACGRSRRWARRLRSAPTRRAP